MGMYKNEDSDNVVPAPRRDNNPELDRQIRQLRESFDIFGRKLDEANQKISRLSSRVRQLETQVANLKRL